MGWNKAITTFLRTVLLALIILIGPGSSAFSQTVLIAEINALLDTEQYDEAYELASDPALDDISEINMIRGTLLGFDLLSSGRDICKAVVNFEKIPLSYISLRWALDYLYGGEWARIAANEGNPQALYLVGERLFNLRTDTQTIIFFTPDRALAIKNAYTYFYNSAELGHLAARERLVELETSYSEIDFSIFQTKIQFKQSLCPIREVAL